MRTASRVGDPTAAPPGGAAGVPFIHRAAEKGCLLRNQRAGGYAASCMSIRPVLRVVALPNDGSTYLAGLEGSALLGWDAVGVLG
jgi:hypothetical protein